MECDRGRTSSCYTATQVVLRSRSGWWFHFWCWNNLKISVMSRLFDDGLIFLTGQYLSGETHFQWKPPAASSDLTHFPKGSAKKVQEVYWSCWSISSIQRSNNKKSLLIPRSRKKTSPIPLIPNWQKKVIDTCRNIAKQEGIPLRQSYSRVTPPTPSSGIEQEKSAAEKMARKATRRLQTIGRTLVRELLRKMPLKQISPYAQTLLDA